MLVWLEVAIACLDNYVAFAGQVVSDSSYFGTIDRACRRCYDTAQKCQRYSFIRRSKGMAASLYTGSVRF